MLHTSSQRSGQNAHHERLHHELPGWKLVDAGEREEKRLLIRVLQGKDVLS